MRTLVVYYSRTGHTRQVAELLAQKMNADLQELIDRSSRKGLVGWLKSGRDAVKEKEAELAPLDHSPKDYDLVVVGTPVWASHPAPAVRTFLGSYDLSGKQVAFFCTMKARGGEETCAVMRDLIQGVEVAGHLTVAMRKETEDEIARKVTQWAEQLKGGE